MKIRTREKNLCGGRLIVTNFKKLNPKMFKPLYDYTKKELQEELAVCAPNGSVYINAKKEGCELVYGIFESIMPEHKYTLEAYTREIKKRFPEIKKIKTFEDWAALVTTETENEIITHALTVLMIPVELKRREIERSYYGKIRNFSRFN